MVKPAAFEDLPCSRKYELDVPRTAALGRQRLPVVIKVMCEPFRDGGSFAVDEANLQKLLSRILCELRHPGLKCRIGLSTRRRVISHHPVQVPAKLIARGLAPEGWDSPNDAIVVLELNVPLARSLLHALPVTIRSLEETHEPPPFTVKVPNEKFRHLEPRPGEEKFMLVVRTEG